MAHRVGVCPAAVPTPESYWILLLGRVLLAKKKLRCFSFCA